MDEKIKLKNFVGFREPTPLEISFLIKEFEKELKGMKNIKKILYAIMVLFIIGPIIGAITSGNFNLLFLLSLAVVCLISSLVVDLIILPTTQMLKAINNRKISVLDCTAYNVVESEDSQVCKIYLQHKNQQSSDYIEAKKSDLQKQMFLVRFLTSKGIKHKLFFIERNI